MTLVWQSHFERIYEATETERRIKRGGAAKKAAKDAAKGGAEKPSFETQASPAPQDEEF